MTIYRQSSFSMHKNKNYQLFNTSNFGRSVFVNEFEFNPLEMLEIFNDDRQIKVINRPQNPKILNYLKTIAPQLNEGGVRYVLEAHEVLSKRLIQDNVLPDYDGKENFLADLDYLTNLYKDLTGCPQVGIRLEVLTKAMCPKFHVDKTGIRLLCTYLGQGTQWLEDSCADRSKLGMNSSLVDDYDSGLILDQDGIHEAQPFAIALLKGSLWQNNHMLGVIHRSPAVSHNQIRLLFSLDAIW